MNCPESMFRYVLKGAVVDWPQLVDRAERLKEVGLPLSLELHTFGSRDLGAARASCVANIARLQEENGPADLTVHVPLQLVKRITETDFDLAQVADAIAFAEEIGAPRVVLHRYWGMVYGQAPQRCDRETATGAFNEMIKELAKTAGETLLLVENVGYYSLLPRDHSSFLAGPLDHFFPWEISAFRAFLAAERIANVEPFVDVAHATLSANIFNWKRTHHTFVSGDARFAGVLECDLQRTSYLHPFDFIDSAMPWLHLSDSIFYEDPSLHGNEIPLEALISEGIEIGAGNLPWENLGKRLSAAHKPGLVLEVEPARDETHQSNGAQARSLARVRATLEEQPSADR